VKSGNDLQGADRRVGLLGIKEDLNVVNDICLVAHDLLGGDVESSRPFMSAEGPGFSRTTWPRWSPMRVASVAVFALG
jgi:hypothetical protein